MILRQENGLEYYQFKLFSDIPGLRHAVFTRRKGTSNGAYASLNVGGAVGDSSEQVACNRDLISTCLGNARLQFIEQVHGDAVALIDADHPLQGPALPRADALATKSAGVVLVTQVADCQAVLICDPQQKVVANIHSGWRGSIQNIIGGTVAILEDRFGCHPASLLAGIGPSLGPCCAEFINYRTELPPEFWQHGNERDHFDFWAISRDQLLHAGLLDTHIETAGLCTRCHTDLFFSYRAERITGRFAAAIGLEAI